MTNQGCQTLYLCNLDPRVDESMLQAVLSTISPVDYVQMEQNSGCYSLADGDTCRHAYIHFHDHHGAAQAYLAMDGRSLFGRNVVAKWKEPQSQAHFSIYIRPAKITDAATLLEPFKENLSNVRPLWHETTGKATDASVASFTDRAAAESAVNALQGKQLRGAILDCHMETLPSFVHHELHSKADEDSSSNDGDEDTCYEHIFTNAPLHVTTVKVSKLPHGVTKQSIVSNFQQYGYVSHVHLQTADTYRKGHALVSMDTHANAAMALFSLQKLKLEGRSVSVKWHRSSSSSSTLPSSSVTTSQQQRAHDYLSPVEEANKRYTLSPFFDHHHPHHHLQQKNTFFPTGSPQKVQLEMPGLNSYNVQPMWSASGMPAQESDVHHGSNNHTYQYYHGNAFNL
ncbi:hypothetical protein BDB00DRAFT_942271 [Zychaea mexicana]|uniref:uncharacterized protein n=1 Tax=Zychaea mexicana TaxID=64656 RepID=UPI0022FE8ED4|nr:uncharacterized protein BDB00DRAFT_942271 [Zychaea mexicana]KAI9488502.1 hypothetical protein BDB00DRAFT_942271 [Zychaea mexicana]